MFVLLLFLSVYTRTFAFTVNVREPPKELGAKDEINPVTFENSMIAFSGPQGPEKFCEAVAKAAGKSDDYGAECVLYDSRGERLDSLINIEHEQEILLVKKGFHFVWPTHEIGENFTLPWPQVDGKSIVMETLNQNPPIFHLYNFLSPEDVDQLVNVTKNVELERSTGGLQKRDGEGQNQGEVTTARTSTNAWEQESEIALKLKRRSFDLCRVPFNQAWADGLQVVHYNTGEYYESHHDFFDANAAGNEGWDFNPQTGGFNRMATVFLYLNDVELGGETVFPDADWNGEKTETPEQTAILDEARDRVFANDSNHRGFVDECRKKFTVRPKKGDAILFYSQNRAGKLDHNSRHGACPVLKGEKWGANIWVWNGPFFTIDRADRKKAGKSLDEGPLDAYIVNDSSEDFDLFWSGFDGDYVFQETLKPGGLFHSNTFVGHQFIAQRNGEVIMKWEMERSENEYKASAGDLDVADVVAKHRKFLQTQEKKAKEPAQAEHSEL